jgi:hypothetical protein
MLERADMCLFAMIWAMHSPGTVDDHVARVACMAENAFRRTLSAQRSNAAPPRAGCQVAQVGAATRECDGADQVVGSSCAGAARESCTSRLTALTGALGRRLRAFCSPTPAPVSARLRSQNNKEKRVHPRACRRPSCVATTAKHRGASTSATSQAPDAL